ncbi:MAG: type III-B CRISPR module RAMP protein Cmr4 [Burkholderiales bacterium]
MFTEQRLLFYYAVTPVHMGAGQAVGAIDNPIQREVHTHHPLIAGSGIKGAIRHFLEHHWKDNEACGLIKPLFGPDTSKAGEHAGALSFTDAALVAFPIRCAKRAYVYATCPTALARLKRMAQGARVECAWTVPQVPNHHALLASDAATSVKESKLMLLLEVFEFDAVAQDPDTAIIAEWLSRYALPPGGEHQYFRDKLHSDLVVLADADFGHFVRHATVVEPHVRIDNEKGTAAEGGLFYTENLPPESLLAGLAMASVERTKGGRSAKEMIDSLLGGNGIRNKLVQFGGDATTGRGLVMISQGEGMT